MPKRTKPVELSIVPDGPYWSIAERRDRKPTAMNKNTWEWDRSQWFDTLDKAVVALVNRQTALGIELSGNAPDLVAALHDAEKSILATFRRLYPEA